MDTAQKIMESRMSWFSGVYRCVYIYRGAAILRDRLADRTPIMGVWRRNESDSRLPVASCTRLDASWFEFLSLEPGRVKAGHTYSRAEPDCYANSVNVA